MLPFVFLSVLSALVVKEIRASYFEFRASDFGWKTAALRHVHISYTIHYIGRRTAQRDCFIWGFGFRVPGGVYPAEREGGSEFRVPANDLL